MSNERVIHVVKKLAIVVVLLCGTIPQAHAFDPVIGSMVLGGLFKLFDKGSDNQPRVAQFQSPTVRVTLTVQDSDLRPKSFNCVLPNGQQAAAAWFEGLPIKKEAVGPLIKVHVAYLTGGREIGRLEMKVDGKPIRTVITPQGALFDGRLVDKSAIALRDNENEENWWMGLVKWGNQRLGQESNYRNNDCITTRFVVQCPFLACIDTTMMAEGPHSIEVLVAQKGKGALTSEAMCTFYLSRGAAIQVANASGGGYQPPTNSGPMFSDPSEFSGTGQNKSGQTTEYRSNNGNNLESLKQDLRPYCEGSGKPYDELFKPSYFPIRCGKGYTINETTLIYFVVKPNGELLKQGKFIIEIGSQRWESADGSFKGGVCWKFDSNVPPDEDFKIFSLNGRVLFDSRESGMRTPKRGYGLWLPILLQEGE